MNSTKKIGLVTCYFHPNYGSMLQAYATQKIIQDWGFSCENINIQGLKKEIDKTKTKFYLKQLHNPQILFGTIMRIGNKIFYSKIMRDTLGKDLNVRSKSFEEFKETHFLISKKYESKSKLHQACLTEYSNVLLGSDQLWLPSNIDADYYTLTWVPDEVNKIAYATSFGTSFLPAYQFEKANFFISRINHLSVREKSGKNLVKDLTNLDIPVVCDPTLLFTAEEWMCIQRTEKIIKEKYILCYFLGNNHEDREFAKRLKKHTGFKIVALLHLDEYIKSDINYADKSPYNIGPGELLNLIKNAEYIITDSFHGSVFSILYRKPFFTSRRIRSKGILNTNNRLDNLFEQLEVEGRLIQGNEDLQECLNRNIDYDKVHANLDIIRRDSKKFLYESLTK